MTKEVIEQYNYQHFIRTNKSYSTQNQWINAIKLYLKVNDLSNLKHRALLMLVYGAGLRIGEALNLNINDIRSRESLIYIRGGKGKKDRRVPLSTKHLDTLRTYYKAYRPKAYLFVGPNGSHYTSSSAAKVLKRAGITSQVTLHTLRHSYASAR